MSVHECAFIDKAFEMKVTGSPLLTGFTVLKTDDTVFM